MTEFGRASIHTATLAGTSTVPVEVQADVGLGLPCFHIVGMADAAVLEARQRVRSAIKAAGYRFPNASVVVNLAPAPLRKHGTGFDLPVATAILVATGQLSARALDGCALVGELSLSGRIEPVAGLLAHACAARDTGRTLVGPPDLMAYSGVLPDLTVRAASHISQIAHPTAEECDPHDLEPLGNTLQPDMAEVVGQAMAKRTLEVAAAGGHNLLMLGPPGSGKSMLARRLPGLLPPLGMEQRLQTALVHSVAGLGESAALQGVRPFREPHHTCTAAGMVGGGSPPRPGEASLAHNGVLFLDELTHFGPAVLQSLRQPLEDGFVTLVRAQGRVRYPSRFSLVAAANPCPCGYLGDGDRSCECAPASVIRYRDRIGGPLLDRIDMSIRVDRVDPSLLVTEQAEEASSKIASRVMAAHLRALERGGQNSELSGSDLLAVCGLNSRSQRTLVTLAKHTAASGRAITRVLRVARTIADLEGTDLVASEHLEEAFGYRVTDRGVLG